LLFGSSESETIRSQITPELQISSFIFLGFSLLFCVTSALMRVRTKKKEVKRCFIQKILRFIKNCARVIWPSKSEPEDYFSRKPNSINVYVNQINRYSKEARKSIIWRHRFLNLSAILTLFGFLCIARMIFSLIFDP